MINRNREKIIHMYTNEIRKIKKEFVNKSHKKLLKFFILSTY